MFAEGSESEERGITATGRAITTIGRDLEDFADLYRDGRRAVLAVDTVWYSRWAIVARTDSEAVVLRDSIDMPVAAAARRWAMIVADRVRRTGHGETVWLAGDVDPADVPVIHAAWTELGGDVLVVHRADLVPTFAAILGRERVLHTPAEHPYARALARAEGGVTVSSDDGHVQDTIRVPDRHLDHRLVEIGEWGVPPPQVGATIVESYARALLSGVKDVLGVENISNVGNLTDRRSACASRSELLAALRARLNERGGPYARVRFADGLWDLYRVGAEGNLIAVAVDGGSDAETDRDPELPAGMWFAEEGDIAYATRHPITRAYIAPRVLPAFRGTLVRLLRSESGHTDETDIMTAVSLLVTPVERTERTLILTHMVLPVVRESAVWPRVG